MTVSNVYCPTCGELVQTASQGARMMEHARNMAANATPFKPPKSDY